jgi:hypothetical protein
MGFTLRGAGVAGVLVGAGLLAGVAAPASRPAPGRLVVGKPVTTPGPPRSGQRFTVSFAVSRSGTHAAPGGRLTIQASVGGRRVPFTRSYTGRKAKVSMLVPANAIGRVLTVRVDVKAGALRASRTARFRVVRGQPLGSLSIGDASVTEGTEESMALSFPVTLSAPDPQTVTVRYTTADGTAVQPRDYLSSTGTVTFAPGTTRQIVKVWAVPDSKVEPDEQLTVVLSGPVRARIADGVATGTIVADDFGVQVGPYEGTTSQGGAVSFEVSPDREEVHKLVIRANRNCDGQGGTWETLDYTGSYNAPVDRDLSFNGDLWTSEVPVEVFFYGDLAENAPATGGLTLTWRDGWKCKLSWSAS